MLEEKRGFIFFSVVLQMFCFVSLRSMCVPSTNKNASLFSFILSLSLSLSPSHAFYLSIRLSLAKLFTSFYIISLSYPIWLILKRNEWKRCVLRVRCVQTNDGIVRPVFFAAAGVVCPHYSIQCNAVQWFGFWECNGWCSVKRSRLDAPFCCHTDISSARVIQHTFFRCDLV